jgi:membrane protein DedA with SNARE-associated domain
MSHHLLDLLRSALVHYGYWAVAAALLLENAGLPVPGETVLLLASFLAYSQRELQISWIVLIGTVSATLGDNLGYAVGHYSGRRLLERYKHTFIIGEGAVKRGEALFASYGAATILCERFVFVMRVIAGPMAGILRMPWRSFAVFNLLGAALWVAVIACVGFFFGSRWGALTHFMKRFDIAIAVVFIICVSALSWRKRRSKELG